MAFSSAFFRCQNGGSDGTRTRGLRRDRPCVSAGISRLVPTFARLKCPPLPALVGTAANQGREPLALPTGRYGLIVADPPWQFRSWKPGEASKDKGPRRHYGVMAGADLASLPVASLAEDDCVLALWATQAQLHHAIALIDAWGFQYKTAGTWAKRSRTGNAWAFGTGYILRSAAEFFLIGTKGHPKSESRSERNLIVAPLRAHSEKPEDLQYMLERMYPHARKLELFARRRRSGWTCWGDQLPDETTARDAVAPADASHAPTAQQQEI